MLLVPHPSAGYAAHNETNCEIPPCLHVFGHRHIYSTASCIPAGLACALIDRHPCKPDVPVPSTRIFSRPRPAPTRPRQSRKKNARDYRPGATSLGDDTVKLNSRLNTTYSQDLTRRGPRPGVFAIELMHYIYRIASINRPIETIVL